MFGGFCALFKQAVATVVAMYSMLVTVFAVVCLSLCEVDMVPKYVAVMFVVTPCGHEQLPASRAAAGIVACANGGVDAERLTTSSPVCLLPNEVVRLRGCLRPCLPVLLACKHSHTQPWLHAT